MPYSLLVCRACDAHVMTPEPHGPEDEYCEGERGYERIEAFTQQELERRLLAQAAIEDSTEFRIELAASQLIYGVRPSPTETTCPVCSQSLSYESPGRYVCDVCEVAYAEGKTIEQVRDEIASLARDVTAMFSGTRPRSTITFSDGSTGIIHTEPDADAPPNLDWPAIDEDARSWQDSVAPDRRDHFVAELERIIRLAANRPFRGHRKAERALRQVARQHALTPRAKAGKGPRKRRAYAREGF